MGLWFSGLALGGRHILVCIFTVYNFWSLEFKFENAPQVTNLPKTLVSLLCDSQFHMHRRLAVVISQLGKHLISPSWLPILRYLFCWLRWSRYCMDWGMSCCFLQLRAHTSSVGWFIFISCVLSVGLQAIYHNYCTLFLALQWWETALCTFCLHTSCLHCMQMSLLFPL